MRNSNLIEAIGNTPLVELPTYSPKPGVRIFAKLEGHNPTGSVKDRIARAMVRAALEDGLLTKDRVVLEPTSGNTGISLAMVLSNLGYRFTAVMPDNVSPERTELLKAYGASIIYSPGEEGSNGSIAMAKKIVEETPSYLMLFQYGNEANPGAHYETTGPEIIRDLPEVTHFVAGLGTGGTLMGVGRRLKEYNSKIEVIAAAPEPDDRIQGLRSLEEGFVPPILDLKMLDRRIMIGGEESFRQTADVLRREGVFAGVSSGAVLAAAIKVAERLDEGNIVALFADGGWKYLSTGLWTKRYAELKGDVEGRIWW
ncbi:MAG: cysteine synthase family protein [Chloroflexi bacterium]|nr:cysteine synthase family protein [Chloroflexota bacterium]